MCKPENCEAVAIGLQEEQEQFEAEIQTAYENNKERPDLFVKHLQDVLQMSEFDIVKELYRYPVELLAKFYIYITTKEQ